MEKKALNKKVATNFMKAMTTKIASPMRMPKPSKRALPLTKEEAVGRIMAMKGLQRNAKMALVNRIRMGAMSPRRVVKVARVLSRLNVPSYRIAM
jgi:NAD(P)H-nitrite reductase large subunit